MKKSDTLFSKLELKEIKQEGDYGIFAGYASVFDFEDSDCDVIMKGAFNESLSKRPNVKMLWQHRMDMPIGIYPVIKEDNVGLYVEGQINLVTEKGKEAYALAKQGALDAMSIGFITKECEYDQQGQKQVRKIKAVDLFEISLVTFPANEKATMTNVKSFIKPSAKLEDIDNIRDFERLLRDELRCSWKQAALIAKHGFKAVDSLRDEDVADNKAQEILELAKMLGKK